MGLLKKILFNKVAFFILLTLIGFWVGSIIEQAAQEGPDLEQYQADLENELHRVEKEIGSVFNNGSFLLNAVEGYVLEDTVIKYNKKPFTLIIYNDNDSIVYWNNSRILPFQSDIEYSRTDTIVKYEISNSIYLKIRKPYDFLIDGKTYYYNLEALIPLYKHYTLQNNYIQNYFPLMERDFSDYVTISEEPTEAVIRASNGTPMIYLKTNESYPFRWYIVFSTLLYFLSSFLVLVVAYLVAQILSRKGYISLPLFFLTGAILIFRLFTISYDFPLLAHKYEVFNFRLSDANNIWFYSLGDFLIDMGLLFMVAIFISRELRLFHTQKYNYFQKVAFKVVSYIITIGGVMFIQFSLRDIVNSSYISFDFDDFSNLDSFTFLCLFGIGLMLLSFFFITFRFFYLSKRFKFPFRTRALLFGLSMLGMTIAVRSYGLLLVDIGVMIFFSSIHGLLMRRFVQSNTSSLAWVSVWLFFFSSFITFIIENSSTDKDLRLRKQYAKQLAFERDEETEHIFNTLAPQIQEDGLLQISLNNPLSPSPRSQVTDLINYRYLDNYFFGLYDYSIHIYSGQGRPYRGENRDFKEIVDRLKNSQPTNSKYLKYYSDPEGSFSYIAQLPITQNEALLGIIVIEFTPKKSFKKSNIYVELLSRDKERLESIYSQFTYALYKYDERVATNGSNFKAQLAYDLPRPEPGKYLILRTPNGTQSNYLMYKDVASGHNISIIQVPKFNIFKILSVFAYLFCFSIFLLIFIQIVNFSIKKLSGKDFLRVHFDHSLREQIQRGILLVTLSSFVAIAIITIIYYSYEYNNYHRSRLQRKVASTAKTAVWQIHESKDSVLKLPSAKDLADIHRIDVNIYDLGGNLLSSSEKVVFERHLLSRKMDPRAYHKMKQEQQSKVIQTEFINNFEYLAAYVPLKDKEDNTIAYLNLPYDLAGSSNIGSQDVVKFLGALLNVYVIFLLIAGGAAFIIASSVTNPLSVIGEKLDKIKLGQKNDPIEWNNNDEIGELVERYNQMIQKLEENTKELARSQRESAWREMAKQVAHEIKNPLTPMKLNIQLLKRVVNTNPEQAQKMVAKASNALIEQIDSLAKIASEFSNFAKMPMANNEKICLNELVENAYELFKEEENVQLSLDLHARDCFIWADKTQIMRVLNNLIKNAIQAIPEDQPGLIGIQLGCTSTTAIIKVSDNGIGIPEEQAEDIFVPNFTTKSSGTGIGLAMSKKIVEMSKGFIYFESTVGEGTEFIVELPLMKEGI